mgnify:CR=1 FL=1
MKIKLLLVACSVLFVLSSCSEEEIPQPKNTIGNDIKALAEEKGVQFVYYCYPPGSSCTIPFGDEWYSNYTFVGDNSIRIGSTYFNLNQVKRYEVKTLSEKEKTEIWLVLHLVEF